MKDKFQKATALALTFSIAALALSVYSTIRVSKGGADETFNARVEQGIQAFIQKQQNQENAQAKRIAEKVDNNIEDSDPVMGDKDADITLVEFSDYQCPYCERFFTNTLSQLKSAFFDTDKVKLVFRDYPLPFHDNARPAAMAAECVAEEDGDKTYFAFHDKIFQNQKDLNSDNLKKWVKEVGVNMNKFNDCFDNQKTGAEVDADFSVGQNSGISGTPGFLLLMPKDESGAEELKAMELTQQGQYVIQYIETQDGERMGLRISGAHPYSTFEKAIQVGL
ncbi:MAG: thioredoxin domain-containing protein [Candidatus Peregrinibacteria bacterium]